MAAKLFRFNPLAWIPHHTGGGIPVAELAQVVFIAWMAIGLWMTIEDFGLRMP